MVYIILATSLGLFGYFLGRWDEKRQIKEKYKHLQDLREALDKEGKKIIGNMRKIQETNADIQRCMKQITEAAKEIEATQNTTKADIN